MRPGSRPSGVLATNIVCMCVVSPSLRTNSMHGSEALGGHRQDGAGS
jgi:hypothetical protein